jgi:uncharacterized membrane protein
VLFRSIGVVAAADTAVVATQLASTVLVFGSAVAFAATAYLLTNQLRPRVWRIVPVKEIAIGVLFAAGTVVPVAWHLPSSALLPWLLFAALCTMNCISIAVWERWLDVAQQRISIATAFPGVGVFVLTALLLIAIVSFEVARRTAVAQSIYACIGVSAMLLALVHVCRRRVQPDMRTALADIVLLTPAVLLVAGWF